MQLETAEITCRGVTFRIAHDPSKSYQHFTHDDESSVRERWWDIKPGDIVLDVGAAYGSYGLLALALGADRVVFWSPQHDEAPVLRESLKLNGWLGRAAVITHGAWSKPGFISVFEGSLMPIYEGEAPHVGGVIIGGATLPVDTVDNTVIDFELPRVDWMKLDVEGAEEEVLKGGIGIITAFRPKIIIENHQFKDAGLQGRCAAFLQGLGYREVGTVPHHGVSHSLYVCDR